MKPGSVNSAERAPPPILSRASRTQTEHPARAISIPAARPFGPDPTTTASNSIGVLYTLQSLRLPLQSLRSLTRRGESSARAASSGDGSAGQSGRGPRNRRAARSINCADGCDRRVRRFVVPCIRAPQGTDLLRLDHFPVEAQMLKAFPSRLWWKAASGSSCSQQNGGRRGLRVSPSL